MGLSERRTSDDRRTSAERRISMRQKRKRSSFAHDKEGKGGEDDELEGKDLEKEEEDINDVIDLDEAHTDDIITKKLVPEFLCNPWFRFVSYLFIILNAILLGLETEPWFADNYLRLSEVVKELTMGFFICEILLKWYCGFWIFWKSNWNILDFIIVGLSVIGPELRYWSCGRVLRLLRACLLIRAIEAIDKLEVLKGLRPIIEGLLMSLTDMINIGLLLILILLALAIAANNLLAEHLPTYYGDLGAAFFSLFILTTQDGIIIQYKSFEPQSLYVRSIGAILFFVTIMAGAFIFINIIVGISCYNLDVAVEAAEEEEEEEDDEEEGRKKMDIRDESSDDPVTEILEKLNILSKHKALRGLNLVHLQKPYQLADFSHLSLAKLEKYFIVLSALEENLAEYQDIKRDFEEARSSARPHNFKHFEDMIKRGVMKFHGIPGKHSKRGSESTIASEASSAGSKKFLSPTHVKPQKR